VKITYYGYNSFIIDTKNKKMAIDPGGSLYFLKLSTVIPKEEWESITHIFVTHGDPDHYWHTDRVQQVSGAKVVCNKAMLKEIDGKEYMIGPRDRGLSFTLLLENLYQIEENETIELDDMSITGIKTVHRPLRIKIGPFEKVLRPGPKERIGIGSIGYKIIVDGQEIVNLGDTILLEKEWYTINKSDVLMILIGGADYKNTMD
jgi:L-ascorbate metabolism protein UlaG (beta-lactamase superfamily)